MDPIQPQISATALSSRKKNNGEKADRTGQQLGTYRLLHLLADGGFAELYLGEHIHLNTYAAIKVLHAQLASEELEQFREEARIVALLRHPHKPTPRPTPTPTPIPGGFMITHVVLLQPNASSTDEEISAVLRQVEALREVIPGLVGIAVGKNQSTYHRGYTYGIIMHFIDEAHLQAHHPHPAHVAAVEALDRICESTIDFDLPEAGTQLSAYSAH